MTGLQHVWLCAQDLQLIRADRIISLLVPIGTGYGAAPPGDQALHRAVCAEIEGGTGGEAPARVKLADCGKSPAAQLLAGLAAALASAPTAALDRVACSSSPSEIRPGSPAGPPPASSPPPGRKAPPRTAVR